MAEICSICGLPKDICVCSEISKEQQKIVVRKETRKYRRAMTIISGMEEKDVNLSRLAQEMKSFCACGGTAKNGRILLQGDQRDKLHIFLIKNGYPEENLEIQ